MFKTKSNFARVAGNQTISYIAVLLMVLAMALCGCGKAVGTESLPDAEEAHETEELQEAEEPLATEESQEAEASQETEESQSGPYGAYDLDALFGPEQEDYSEFVSVEYIGNQLIETEYAILDPEEGVILTQEEIDRIDFLCKTIEEVTGLSFLNGKYYNGKKITFHIYEYVPSASAEDITKAIDIDTSCLRGENFLVMVHELMHIMQCASVYTGAFPFYSEGYAEYWTHKIAVYIQENAIEGLVELVDLEGEIGKWNGIIAGVDVTQIYEKNIDEWMDQGCYFAFADSWPAYIYGRYFFTYLEDVYGDANAFLPIYARIPFASTGVDWEAGIAGRKFMDMEPLKKMMMVAYSEDVFKNFYPWLKDHEELFEPYIKN